MLCYYWPPLGGPGALRPVKFARYLPDFGVDPIVVTRRDIAYHSYDPDLAAEVPDTRTYRTETFDPARVMRLFGRTDYRPRRWQRPVKIALNFPDNKVGWIPFAYACCRRHRADAVFATAPPFSAFITAYYASRSTGLPLVVDFRDAWREFPFMRYHGRLQHSLVDHWERKVVTRADAITVVDADIARLLQNKYPDARNKIHVLPNGFDPADFTCFPSERIFTIAHLGTIRRERDPDVFLRAVDGLIREGRIPSSAIQVRFIGHVEPEYQSRIAQHRFAVMPGHLPHRTALRQLASAHVALLITTGDSYFFPSRQHEYLASGRPVLVCGISTATHVLTEAFRRGYPGTVVAGNAVPEIKRAILDWFERYHAGTLPQGVTPYQDITRTNVARQLAEIVKRIARRSGAAPLSSPQSFSPDRHSVPVGPGQSAVRAGCSAHKQPRGRIP